MRAGNPKIAILETRRRTPADAFGHPGISVPSGDIDPAQIRTLDDLVFYLRRLRLRAGNPSLRQLQKWARDNSKPGNDLALPRSSVADALAGQHLPPRRLVLALVEACGVKPDALDPWADAWERVAVRHVRLEGELAGSVAGSRAWRAERNVWEFDDQQPVTIVCPTLPKELRSSMPYADPDSPHYVEMYTYADLDALIDLYGHLHRANSDNQILIRTTSSLSADDHATHLVLLGGVDWNSITRELLDGLRLPVKQVSPADADAYFEAAVGDDQKRFYPKLRMRNGRQTLVEDVAHVFRGPNPFNNEATVTMCNGIFGRGTLGAVRMLTDPRLRERNESYIRSAFAGMESFSILARVLILNRRVVTPDLTNPGTRLHEFSR
jgi:hypothetical protein